MRRLGSFLRMFQGIFRGVVRVLNVPNKLQQMVRSWTLWHLGFGGLGFLVGVGWRFAFRGLRSSCL